MLDFNKLIGQIGQVGSDSLSETLEDFDTLAGANEAYDQAAKEHEQFAEKLVANAPLVLWPVATPLEAFGNTYEVAPRVEPVTVIGVDGSQIMPSHHEVHACYLLNIGLATITYGKHHAPVLESVPLLYHRPEELYPLVDRRRLHIDELYISLERTVLELTTLLEKCREAKKRGTDIVALYDGSLISWSADKLPESYQERHLEKMGQALAQFETERIPVIGYISHSRASDVINTLRISICPFEHSRCRDLCGHLNEEDFPCSKIWPLADRNVMREKLALNYRSATFASGSRAAKALPHKQQIGFTYLNTGNEIARLEFPLWLFKDQALYNTALSTTLSQSQKGKGYPIALSEAHHLAVIRGGDRERFFALMTDHLVGLGVRKIQVSQKESKKRIGFV